MRVATGEHVQNRVVFKQLLQDHDGLRRGFDGGFDGLRALVTGGASGIGLATARLLTARGARVACLDLRPDDVGPPGCRSAPSTAPARARCTR